MMSDERQSPDHCLIWSKHWNTCFLGSFMTCLKNDFVHHGRPLMYEVLPQDFSTSMWTTFFLFPLAVHTVEVSLNYLHYQCHISAEKLYGKRCVNTFLNIRSHKKWFDQRYKEKMFSFYTIWFSLDRIYTFGVSSLFLMVVLHQGAWMRFSPLPFGDCFCWSLCWMGSWELLGLLLADPWLLSVCSKADAVPWGKVRTTMTATFGVTKQFSSLPIVLLLSSVTEKPMHRADGGSFSNFPSRCPAVRI